MKVFLFFLLLLGGSPLAALAQSDSPHLQHLLDSVKQGGTITLSPRTYSLDAPLRFDHARNVTLDGNGARLRIGRPVPPPGNQNGIVVSWSENVSLKNLSLDFDPLPFTQGVVQTVAATYLDVRLDAGYPQDSGQFASKRVDVAVFNNQTRAYKATGAKLFQKPLRQVAAGVFRVFCSPKEGNVEVGDAVALAGGWGGGTIALLQSQGTQVTNVTVYSSPGGGLIESFGAGGTAVSRLQVRRGPRPAGATKDRLLSTNRDAFHSASVVQGPSITDCTFEFMGDDGINLEGGAVTVRAVSGNVVSIDNAKSTGVAWQPGDAVAVYAGATLASQGTRKVVSALNSPPPGVARQLTLTDAQGIQPGDFLVTDAYCGNGAVIRHNTISGNEARGILIRGSNVLVENNTIENTTIGGIWVGPERGSFVEGGYSQHVTIRGNTLRGIGQSLRSSYPSIPQLGAITVGIGTTQPAQLRGNAVLQYLTIEQNNLEDVATVGIFISDARHVRVCGNTLRGTNRTQLLNGQTSPVYGIKPDMALYVRDADDVTLFNNTIVAQGPYGTRGSVAEAATTTAVALTALSCGPAFAPAAPAESGTAALAIEVFPNPAAVAPTLSYVLPAAAAPRLRVLDALGRLVVDQSLGAQEAGPHQQPLPGGRLAAGLYLVQLQAGKEQLSTRLLVPAGY